MSYGRPRYQYPSDPSSAAWDSNFQGYGSVLTDQAGRYRFRTIMPGAYPISRAWMRPPHIHFKFKSPGSPTLTTQMYFAGHDLNREDGIIGSLTPAQRKLVLVEFNKHPRVLQGHFEVVLSKEGRYSGLLSPRLS